VITSTTDGRRFTRIQQTGSSSYFPVLARYLKVCIKSGIPRPALFIVDNKDEMEIEIKVIDLLQGR
jgi:hypothetical protein